MIKPQISYEDFDKVDMRVGKVITVEDFPEASNWVALAPLKIVPLGRGVK